jgi:hypothetical protein
VFHVLLRRLTPRHPPYALSSFLPLMRRVSASTSLRDDASLPTSSPASSSTSLLLLRYAVGKVLAAGTRPAAAEERVFRFRRCPPSAAPERIPAQRSGAKLKVWPPSTTFYVLPSPAARAPDGVKRDKTARHIAGLQVTANRSVGTPN